VTAWDGDLLVGIARTLTDFSYTGYMSDLAVRLSYQRQGIGIELIRKTRERMGPRSMLVLLAAPKAVGYYPKVGFTHHESAWIVSSGGVVGSRFCVRCTRFDRSVCLGDGTDYRLPVSDQDIVNSFPNRASDQDIVNSFGGRQA
jgi:hypothetical protein